MRHNSLILVVGFLLAAGAGRADEVTLGSEKTIVSGATVAQATAAFGDGIYFVVWQDGWPGVDATADIKGLRLKADTLEALDKSPLTICAAPDAQEAPAVVFAEGVFLVVWQDFRNGRTYRIRARLVDAKSGQVCGNEIAIPEAAGNQCRPAVASDGKTSFVVWQEVGNQDRYGIRGLRISSSGKVLDGAAHLYAARGTSPMVSASTKAVLVAWSNRERNRATTAAILVDSISGQISKDLGTINSCCGDALHCSGDGLGNFITVAARASLPDPWGWGEPGAVVFSRVRADGVTPESKLDYGYRLSNLCSRSVPNVVDAAVWKGSKTWDAGAVGGFPGTQDGLWPIGLPAVVHAGKDLYLLAWVKGSIGNDKLTVTSLDIWIRGVGAHDCAVRLADLKAAGEREVDETRPVLIQGPQGEVLLLYLRLKTGAARQIAARRIILGREAK
ncbi:hypothetical protein HRbin36_01278 [bacterium HR36]|nr:hypothetical protein HRbin36_01278 [bacterium HR36]